MSCARTSQGFTLPELMIVTALVGIMAFIAVPNFIQLTRNNQIQAQAEELKAFLTFARGQAVNERAFIDLSFEPADPADPRWEIERRRDNTVLRQFALASEPKAVAMTNSNAELKALTYRPNGTASAAARFTVCYEQQTDTGFLITLQPNGSIRLHPRGKDDDNTTALATCE